MATTVPTHGKYAAIYALRPNGFVGVGVNDVTWGLVATDISSVYYTVTIDAEAAPDTFVWAAVGSSGGGAAGVPITGAAVALEEDQTILHVGTDNHTLSDKWVLGNLFAEPCTVDGSTAQITDVLFQMLNPNAPPTFTPTNAVDLVSINYTNGMATFNGAPGVTTVAGNNGVIVKSALQQVGYLIDWNLSVNLDMADASRSGQEWKESLPGQASASGGASAYFVPTQTLWNCLADTIASGQKYFLLQLYTYDPDGDQTGDHRNVWVTFNDWNVNTSIGDVVKESLSFQVYGAMSANIDNV